MTAGLWLFLFRVLLSPFQRSPAQEPPRDPETLLQQAQQEMRQNQAKNRERAVQAITQKNNLQAELDKTQKIVNNLQAKAALAGNDNDQNLERELLAEAEMYHLTLARLQAALERAVTTTELIKQAVRREETRIRAMTAQVMAAKQEWRQEQITASIEMLAAPDATDPFSTSARLETVLTQIERTSEVLWQEAQTAMAAGEYTTAIRLLTEQQNLARAAFMAQRCA